MARRKAPAAGAGVASSATVLDDGVAVVRPRTGAADSLEVSQVPTAPARAPFDARVGEPGSTAGAADATEAPTGTDVSLGIEVVEVLDLDEEAVTTDPVRAYLTEIGRTPLLDAAQEVELAKRIEAGLYAAERLRQADKGEAELPEGLREDLVEVAADGRAAKAHMLRANLRLVVSVAKKHTHRGLPFLDVVQEGNLGLIRAVEKFDYQKGYKFSTYAMWWIRQAISRGLAEQARTIRLPVHVAEDVNKLSRIARDLSQDLGREPSLEELAGAMQMPLDKVAELRRVSRDTMSLDSPVGDDGDATIGELVVETDAPAAADAVEQRMLTAQVARVVDTLPPREATIVRLRYGLGDGQPRSLEEIGKHLGLTRERIRQLEKEALAKLRSAQAEELLEYAS